MCIRDRVSVTVGDAIDNVAVVDGKGTLTLAGLASGSYDEMWIRDRFWAVHYSCSYS